jgi:3-hydroxyisobutyrate dehydrogenase-like beta-hydroxyacid dehydrogenase
MNHHGVKQLDTLDDFAQIDAVIFMLPNSKIVSEVVTKLLEVNT